MPLTTARRANSAGIESVGDLAKGREPGSLHLPHNRQDTELGAGGFHRRKGGGMGRDQCPAA